MAQTAKKQSGRPAQTMVVQSGNEIAATAAKQINYHVMGYYPITPSTEVAETLDAMKAEGEHPIRMVPGDGEHGGGARVQRHLGERAPVRLRAAPGPVRGAVPDGVQHRHPRRVRTPRHPGRS